MKQLWILMLAIIISCTSRQSTEQPENKHTEKKEHAAATIPLNNGAKWKADETTKKNVAAITQIMNDSTYREAGKRKALAASLRGQLNTLVNQCSMKGAEHDALHIWLEKVLKDVKELEKDDDEYSEVYTTLKSDVARFYTAFE